MVQGARLPRRRNDDDDYDDVDSTCHDDLMPAIYFAQCLTYSILVNTTATL